MPKLDKRSYSAVCKQFGVTPNQVKRPVKIDMLLSARSNYLMSDRVIKSHGNLKLFQGPLGKVFGGQEDSLNFVDPNIISRVDNESLVKHSQVISVVKPKSASLEIISKLDPRLVGRDDSFYHENFSRFDKIKTKTFYSQRFDQKAISSLRTTKSFSYEQNKNIYNKTTESNGCDTNIPGNAFSFKQNDIPVFIDIEQVSNATQDVLGDPIQENGSPRPNNEKDDPTMTEMMEDLNCSIDVNGGETIPSLGSNTVLNDVTNNNVNDFKKKDANVPVNGDVKVEDARDDKDDDVPEVPDEEDCQSAHGGECKDERPACVAAKLAPQQIKHGPDLQLQQLENETQIMMQYRTRRRGFHFYVQGQVN